MVLSEHDFPGPIPAGVLMTRENRWLLYLPDGYYFPKGRPALSLYRGSPAYEVEAWRCSLYKDYARKRRDEPAAAHGGKGQAIFLCALSCRRSGCTRTILHFARK